MACSAVQLSTLPHKQHDFQGEKKVTEHKMRVDFLYKFCLELFSLYEQFSEILSQMYEGNSISKLQIQVATYVFELSAGNCHR